jgi:hypothetical protein
VAEQLVFEVGGFAGGCFDPAGEAAQDESSRELVGACRA